MLTHYGVLAGKAIDRQLASSKSEHFQVLIDANGTKHRIAINVQSQQAPPEVLFYMSENFIHPITDAILQAKLALGYTKLPPKPLGISIDFIRGNLFPVSDMKPIPPHMLLAGDDLNQKLDLYIQQAMKDPEAIVYAFGDKWGPDANIPDPNFHFKPGNGIHDIHMNQGNSGSFKKDNGVYQDGALLIHLPSRNIWVAMFIAFQSQSFHTNDKTGDPIVDGPPEGTDQIKIIAAMVNPKNANTGKELVMLLNKGSKSIDLKNWKIADKAAQTDTISGQTLAAHATVTIHLTGHGAQLGNDGGLITLLDDNNKKVDGVSYTKKQGAQEGTLIKF